MTVSGFYVCYNGDEEPWVVVYQKYRKHGLFLSSCFHYFFSDQVNDTIQICHVSVDHIDNHFLTFM